MECNENFMSLSLVEECLEKNKELEVKLNDATRAIEKRLELVRRRIQEVKEKLYSPKKEDIKLESDFATRPLYVSEWNDMNNSNLCPQNADTIAKYHLTKVPNFHALGTKFQTDVWAPAHDRLLRSIIHKHEVRERTRENSEKIIALRQMTPRNSDSATISAFKKDVAEFKLSAVRKKSLEELVLTGKGSYDWDEVSRLLRTHTPQECKARWFNYLHPSLNTSKWSKEEDIRLIEIAEHTAEQDWDVIAARLGSGRSAYACFTAYQSRLRGMEVRGVHCGVPQGRRLEEILSCEESWTRQDDSDLAAAVMKNQTINGISWSRVSAEFPHHSRKQLFARWSQLLDPSLRTGKLTPIEQKAIVIGVRRFGLSFGKIRNEFLPHRTISQLRHFTLYRINKCKARGRWTTFSEQILRALVEFYGPRSWPKVSSHFQLCTANHLKRKYQTQLKCAPTQHKVIYELRDTIIPLLEYDMETIRLIGKWESKSPLKCCNLRSAVPNSNDYVDSEDSNEDDPSDLGKASGWDDQVSLEPSSLEDPLLEDPICLESNNMENKIQLEIADEKVEISDTIGCAKRRGRPPSKKKIPERTKPKRSYVRSGLFKITVDENISSNRSLRSKNGT